MLKKLWQRLTGGGDTPPERPPAKPKSDTPEPGNAHVAKSANAGRGEDVANKTPAPDRPQPASKAAAKADGPQRRDKPPGADNRRRSSAAASSAGKKRTDTATRKPDPLPDSPPKDTEFARLGIDARIAHATDALGFTDCMPVQRKALPPTLEGKDVLAQAQTGSGKTAAFLVTAIHHFLEGKLDNGEARPTVLVLAPTRELALQIHKDATALARFTNWRPLAVYGGMKFGEQQQELKQGVDMVVATPGRLLDFLKRRIVDLSDIRMLVIDEADRMLDMGFIPDVRRIVRALPPREKRQTLMFSATLTTDVHRLAASWTVDALQVEIEPENLIPKDITETVYSVSTREKLALLLSLLREGGHARTLVFCNRRDRCDSVHRQLLKYGVNSALLTGDVPQKKRLSVLEAFREARIGVIVATDVAGRGIHVEDIGMVVNYDLPYEAEDYVHRIGRTGRAGTAGLAVSFACEEGGFAIPEIEEYIKRSLPTTAPDQAMLKLPHPKPGMADKQVSEAPGRRRSSGNNRRRRPRGGGKRRR